LGFGCDLQYALRFTFCVLLSTLAETHSQSVRALQLVSAFNELQVAVFVATFAVGVAALSCAAAPNA
jgi:hypothetical protein